MSFKFPSISPLTSTKINTLAVIFTVLSTMVLVSFPILDFDIFWHLLYGQQMVQSGSIIAEELFSHSMQGAEFSNHQWLAQVVLYSIFNLLGITGLLLVKVFLVGIISFLMYRTALVFEVAPVGAALLVVVAIFAALGGYTANPKIFNFLFLALCVYLLYGVKLGRLRRAWLWVIPPVIIVWDLMYGSVYGLVLLGAFVFGECVTLWLKKRGLAISGGDNYSTPGWGSIKYLLVVFIATLVAFGVNPYGLFSYESFSQLTASGETFFVLNSGILSTGLFWIMLALCFAGTLVFIRRVHISQVFVVAVFAFMALNSKGGIVPFTIVSTPMLAYYIILLLEDFKGHGLDKTKVLNIAVMVLFVPLALSVGYIKILDNAHPFGFGIGLNESRYPVGVTSAIKELKLKGNMFNPAHMGGYLAYNLYPERKVLMYNLPSVFSKVASIAQDKKVVSQHALNYVIATHEMLEELFTEELWEPVYWDSGTVLMLRKGWANQRTLKSIGLKLYKPSVSTEALKEMEADPLKLRRLAVEVAQNLYFAADNERAEYLASLLLNPSLNMELEPALILTQKGLRHAPDNVALLNAKGQLLFRAKRMDEAIPYLEHATLGNHPLAFTHITMGFIHYEKAQYGLSVRSFKKSIVIDDSLPDAYFGLGLAYKKLGNVKVARSSWEKFLRLNPNGAWADKARQQLKSLADK